MNYLITGAGFANKGAESMLFTLVAELKNREPDCEIYVEVLHGWELINPNEYNFNIFPLNIKNTKRVLNPYYSCIEFCKNSIKKLLGKPIARNDIREVIKNIDVIYDISGYALSSQWGAKPKRWYVQNLKLAKKFKKRIVLFPQSFGPFEFKHKEKVNKNLLSLLKSVDAIFTREKDGFDHLKNLGLDKNIYLSNDMVLCYDKEYKGVYKVEFVPKQVEIKDRSVLIIPNIRVYERSDKNKFMQYYKIAIDKLLKSNYNIYLSYYDNIDRELSNEIKNYYLNNDSVIFVDKILNCIEYDKVLAKFDFVISSRYHSIVHSYKNFIPCIVLGWAVKYKELLENVNQRRFLYDGVDNIEEEQVLSNIEYLIDNYSKESDVIKSAVNKIQQNSCFTKVGEIIYNE